MHIKFFPQEGREYLAFYKPFDILCQFTPEPGSDKGTLAQFGFPKDVYPIGRLDADSEGLLILSDDPRLNSRLLDPKNGHSRTYLAQVENVPPQSAIEKLETGVDIKGHWTLPAKVSLVNEEPQLPEREKPIRFRKNIPTAWLKVTVTEGKNRQVRRMTAAVGHPTLRLVRVAIGTLQLENLDLLPGQWRKLTDEELALTFQW
ncbi:MAG: pseudouridine synthase [Cyanobacteria bacterium DS2.3.42]|nr:pseudouridine synthase [Cyanobacteria bacterium DS2.3.42]